ncbi:MAG: hypothetical protein AAF602_03185 [Myxococcota bacterium]
MTPASPLPPVPVGMNAQVLHDGVRWRVREASTWMLMVALAATMALGVVLLTLVLSGLMPLLLALAALVPLGMVAMATTRVPLAAELRLTDRQVIIERSRLFEVQRTSLRLDELDLIDLTDPPELGGSGQIILRAEHDAIVFGRGLSRDHNAWFVDAVEAACATVARREHREGREYSFLRKPPRAVEALRDTD